MRLFISISVPRGLYRYCAQLQSRFPDLKTTHEFHITVQFLGDEISDEMMNKIIDALSKIKFKKFEIQMGDALPFPDLDNPYGVWIECKETDELNGFANEIRKRMTELKLKPDKPFKAHITLGRYKFPPSKKPMRITGEPHRFEVDRFYLMESRLAPNGSVYKVVKEFPCIR
jgi:2'-5' RNA ligase